MSWAAAPCHSSSRPSSIASTVRRARDWARRLRSWEMRTLTSSWPILMNDGTRAAPKPVARAMAISTTWVKAAMTMLYWVASESRAYW
ncbi:hypothetical protein AFR_02505 [Actinoplanes friuliensis DSM 7358]|uniref:Uncharacterized protein n=1 Tax=Actinoplanes friuliensis DSM 7358 TaxID=1246995 RepID=U5VSU2_9ACTN|nr:hypothetical protein AFR_02505 [Actinoplanes friuliensis DSM 7358]